ncbi:putative transcription factor interactor and regulator CCHC(Zn) family [Helianthus anomalus]
MKLINLIRNVLTVVDKDIRSRAGSLNNLKQIIQWILYLKFFIGWIEWIGIAHNVKKQTYYNCDIPSHIARNCTHHPYVPYYTQNQRVTSRDKSYSKPMKVEKPKAMMNKHPKVKASDGDWNAAKANEKKL